MRRPESFCTHQNIPDEFLEIRLLLGSWIRHKLLGEMKCCCRLQSCCDRNSTLSQCLNLCCINLKNNIPLEGLYNLLVDWRKIREKNCLEKQNYNSV